MAHCYIQAFDDEKDAFRRFLRAYPDAVLLVDTYDIRKGVERVIELAREMGSGFRVSGVRLDSGDLAREARDVRTMLDRVALNGIQIFVSNAADDDALER